MVSQPVRLLRPLTSHTETSLAGGIEEEFVDELYSSECDKFLVQFSESCTE